MFPESISLTNLLSSPMGMLVYYVITLLALEAGCAMSFAEWRIRKQWEYGRILLAYGALLLSSALTLTIDLLDWGGAAGVFQGFLATIAIIILVWAFQSAIIVTRRQRLYLGVNLAGAGLLQLIFMASLLPQALSSGDGVTSLAQYDVLWNAWQAALCITAAFLIHYERRERTSLQVLAFAFLAAGRLLTLFDVPGAIQWGNLIGFPLLTVSLYQSIVGELSGFALELQALSSPSSRQSRQLVFSLESARLTAASLELGSLLPRLAESVALAMNADHAGIFISEPAEDGGGKEGAPWASGENWTEPASLFVAAFYDPLKPISSQSEPIDLSHYPTMRRAMRSREQLHLEPTPGSGEAAMLSEQFGAPELGNVVVQPLTLKDQVVGILLAARYVDHPPFATDETKLCQALAGQIATAIINARFYRRLEHQAVQLADLLEIQQQETSKNQAILESIAEGVVVCNIDGKTILVNEAAERLLYSSREQLLGEPIHRLYARLGFEEFPRVGRDREHTFQSESLGSESRVLQGSVSTVQSANGDPLGQVVVFRDVTSELRAEQAKNEFLATVTHELRTPVTSIKGFAELLSKGMAGDLPASVQGFLETISLNADRMARLVDNILYVSEAEQGEILVHLHSADVAHAIAKAVESAKPAYTERGITCTLEVEENLPQMHIDPAGFRQMLDNVLQNACKFTPRGGNVWISASLHPASGVDVTPDAGVESGEQYLLISIRDTGVGISPEDHDKVFERFYRAPNPLAVEAGGAGVGLTIVKSLVEAHGGRIWVDSEVGEGSQFNIVLPIHEIGAPSS